MDQAAECFKRAYLADARNLDALENLIELFIRSGKCGPAAALASQWTRSHPRCARAWIARAKLNLLAGELASAKAALAAALEIDPANAAVQSALESLGRGTHGVPTLHSAVRTPRSDSPLPFLRPLSPISKAPVQSDPPVLCVGQTLYPDGYSYWTKQTVVWLRRAGVRVGLQTGTEKIVDSYLGALGISELRELKGALEEHIRDGVLIRIHPPTVIAGDNVDDVYLRTRWEHPQQMAYVGMTTFETEGLPKHWVEPCNGMDEIWVLSQRNVTEFARAGVDERKLWATGFGLDPAHYDPSRTEPLPVRGRRRFMFLSVFQWQPRKGWPILVEAFARTFSRHDDVCLVIKTRVDHLGEGGMSADDQITRCLNAKSISREQAAPIIVLGDSLGNREMTSLYRAADAFVLPTRGEGWGIPFMEAMAMGLPTIGTRWSGHLDFMNDGNSYLIDIRGLVLADDEMPKFSPEYRGGLRYADPDMEHLMVLLRQVHDDREGARENSRPRPAGHLHEVDAYSVRRAHPQALPRVDRPRGRTADRLRPPPQAAAHGCASGHSPRPRARSMRIRSRFPQHGAGDAGTGRGRAARPSALEPARQPGQRRRVRRHRLDHESRSAERAAHCDREPDDAAARPEQQCLSRSPACSGKRTDFRRRW